jgi:DNA replication protein DnaC
MSELSSCLRTLGLHATAEGLDDTVARATKERWSTTQILEHVVAMEERERARRSLERRLGRSRLGRFKPIADFDWTWPSQIDRPRVDSALRLDFVEPARNIVLVANQGLGKTTLAQNIAHNAILKGHTALFVTASQMLLDLGSQDSARAIDRRLRYYCGVSLLVIDEVGYLAFDNRNADLLFQVVSRRYEKKPIVLTTNLAFSDWPSVFPNATCAIALIDRIVHHADVLAIAGKSYRLREAQNDSPPAMASSNVTEAPTMLQITPLPKSRKLPKLSSSQPR